MPQLSPQESRELEYAGQVRSFLESEAWTEYGYPALMGYLHAEFPKPSEEGWEEKYRYAHALVTASNTLVSVLSQGADRASSLMAKQSGEEPDVDLA